MRMRLDANAHIRAWRQARFNASMASDPKAKAIIAECKDNAMTSLPPLAFEYAPATTTPAKTPATRQAVIASATYRNGQRGETRPDFKANGAGAGDKLVQRAKQGRQTMRYVRWFHAEAVEYRLVSIGSYEPRCQALHDKLAEIDRKLARNPSDKLRSLRQRTWLTLKHLILENGTAI